MKANYAFAENLRRKVKALGTVAEVCRALDINRQQFNKYLSGSMLPSTSTLRKICSFLDVSEQELFLDSDSFLEGNRALPAMPRRGPLGFFQFAANRFDFDVVELDVGIYECVMPLIEVPGMVVSSLLVVQQSVRQKEFIRITRTAVQTPNSTLLVRGRHKGVIFANQQDIYLIGSNRYPPFQVSFIVLRRQGGALQSFCKGAMMTHGLNGPVSVRMCIFPAGLRTNIRDAIRNLGTQHVSNAGLGKFELEYLFS
jgi:transcriptional regulator with XRE-family HTH domain